MKDAVDVVVREGDCPCPGTPHTEEHVFLEPELTMPVASAAMAAMRWTESTTGAQQAAIIEAYLPASIRSWSFTDERRRPVEIDREAMEELLPWDRGGMELAEAADELYSERLMRPLLGEDSEALAAYVDGLLDVSEPAVWVGAPGAVRAILAGRLGGGRAAWEAVRGPGELTWEEGKLILQLAAEERVGFAYRERARMARADEDAAAAAALSAMRERRPGAQRRHLRATQGPETATSPSEAPTGLSVEGESA